MPEAIANTSPLQYLFQLGLLDLLPEFYGEVWVPEGVVLEVRSGIERGVQLPALGDLPWLHIRKAPSAAVLTLAAGLGAGEREVLALAVETADPLVILDDSLARRFAARLDLPLTGTLGILLKAKQAKRIESIRPYLDRLEALRFRLGAATRSGALTLAKEGSSS
jgi:predicted nucleic acid-binding protein